MTTPSGSGVLAGDLRHVAIIMDGNGRWAEERGLPRIEGHRRGARVVRDITTYARELGLDYLTLYSFSRQNWRRPPLEVAGLMGLLREYCEGERQTLMDNEIKLTTIGDTSRLPPKTRGALLKLCEDTRRNDKMTLCLALDYGGREEIVGAVRQLAAEVASQRLHPEDVTEATIQARLDTAQMPDPDLLLRTSGECRISNFLLWQLAYAELHFSQVRWPDFSREHFLSALGDYAQRQRRFGHVTPRPARGAEGGSALRPLGGHEPGCGDARTWLKDASRC